MGAAVHGEGRRRDGGALALAFAGSLVLHAFLFGFLPSLGELSALLPPEPLPLIARLVRPEPPEPALPKAEPPKSIPRVKASPPKAAPDPPPAPAPALAPAPASTQEPAPVATPEPASPEPSTLPRASIAAPAPIAPAPAPAPVVVAPDRRAIEGYRRDVTDRAARYKRYPRVAIDNNWQGEVVVRMTIGADGRIARLRVDRGSGYEVLDRQALEMFRNAKPLVPVPPALRGREFELELRAVYRLGAQRSG